MKAKFLGIIAALTVLLSFGFMDANAQKHRYKKRGHVHHKEYMHHNKKHYNNRGNVAYLHDRRGHRHLSAIERKAAARYHKQAIREHKQALKRNKQMSRSHTYGFGSQPHYRH